jgi:hypothetical protein
VIGTAQQFVFWRFVKTNDTGRHDNKPWWTGWIEIVGNQPTVRTKALSSEGSFRRALITPRDGDAALKVGGP